MQTKARDAKISHKNIAHAKDDFCQRTRVLSKQSTCKVFPWVCRCSFLKLPPPAHPGTTLYNTCYLTCQALPKPRKPPTQVGGLMPRCSPKPKKKTPNSSWVSWAHPGFHVAFFRLWGGLRANEPNPCGWLLGPVMAPDLNEDSSSWSFASRFFTISTAILCLYWV